MEKPAPESYAYPIYEVICGAIVETFTALGDLFQEIVREAIVPTRPYVERQIRAHFVAEIRGMSCVLQFADPEGHRMLLDLATKWEKDSLPEASAILRIATMFHVRADMWRKKLLPLPTVPAEEEQRAAS